MVDQAKILNCSTCGEDAILVSVSPKHIVRVRRSSKCKLKQRGRGDSCKTSICLSPASAVAEWNREFA